MPRSSDLSFFLLAFLALHVLSVDAFWRMVCGLIQTGRMDPIVNPGTLSSHVHKVSGASNFNFTLSFDSLQASECTSCEIQLYYQHADGTFEDVPNGGTVVYYLGRGENRTNIEPFPPGFKMLTGNMFLRSNDTTTRTYADPSRNDNGRLVSDAISFACLDSSGPIPEQNYMFRTDCDQGMRAQVHFQSCWDGRDYQTDQSHVAYMSQIDNGVCPPSHPRQLIHLFFEIYYGVNDIQKDGGKFVFAQGDPTGFGFHGDFINGWDPTVLNDAIAQCINNDTINGQISQCPPLAESDDPYYDINCPELASIIDEPVRGKLAKLPGCNLVTDGPERATISKCPDYTPPSINYYPDDDGTLNRSDLAVGQSLGSSSWAFAGCAYENGGRVLNDAATSSANMTSELCTQFCASKGFHIAGTENSKECYCGTSIDEATSDCAGIPKMACAGNKTEWCGAPGLLTMWNDTSFSSTSLELGSTYLGNHSATFVGCFTDPGGNSRALQGASEVDTARMTSELCVAFCKDKGFSLAGTEYSQECYCGNENTGTMISDVTQCEARCKGNVNEYCGGNSKMSVWNITAAPPESEKAENADVRTAANGTAVYVDCYEDGNGNGRTLSQASYSSNSMTVDTCASYCQAKNYALFGVEYGRECYCGSTVKPSTNTFDDASCDMPCSGDSIQKCGGSSRISVWNNTVYAPTHNLNTVSGTNFAYLGCYSEGSSGRALGRQATTSQSASSSDSKLTVEKCGNFCASKGFKYMGVEYGGECYCNNEGIVNGAVKSGESECDMSCNGDVRQWCGGRSRINVYRYDGA
ncbi:WSC-domain-containing protein [Xylariaceae sp. FL0016]|nr:WSC-domain-containing protein [Xylariaceae sp. FL0016]